MIRARPSVIAHPSPNFGPRREGALPDLIVIHYTAMETAQAAVERLCDPQFEVSAHYLICPQGRIWLMVEEEARAWHAGAGQWGDVLDVNSRSIGIELANRGDHPFAAAQMAALCDLLRPMMADWAIAPERVIAHSDMAPGRKADPGARFDWRALALEGLSVWPTSVEGRAAALAPAQEGFLWQAFCDAAARFGYGSFAPDLVLTAVRLRFAPWMSGPITARDVAIVTDLAARFPVDRAALNA